MYVLKCGMREVCEWFEWSMGDDLPTYLNLYFQINVSHREQHGTSITMILMYSYIFSVFSSLVTYLVLQLYLCTLLLHVAQFRVLGNLYDVYRTINIVLKSNQTTIIMMTTVMMVMTPTLKMMITNSVTINQSHNHCLSQSISHHEDVGIWVIEWVSVNIFIFVHWASCIINSFNFHQTRPGYIRVLTGLLANLEMDH